MTITPLSFAACACPELTTEALVSVLQGGDSGTFLSFLQSPCNAPALWQHGGVARLD